MSRYIATVIDTTGIQKYIFGSNRLKENIGASHLVKLATTNWVEEFLKEFGSDKTHIPNPEANQLEPRISEDENLVAELIYAGGGNTVLLFRTIEKAKEFTRKLTKKVLEEAPGLNLVIAHHPFDWERQLLQDIIENHLIKCQLDAQKRKPILSVPLLGLGVTATCKSTGLVAVEDTDGKYGIPKGAGYLASREIIAKLKAADDANSDLENMLFKNKPSQYKVARDVDDMGRSEQKISYIAVVHADGNQMGKRFEQYGKAQSKNKHIPEANRDFIIAMRKLSWSVNKAGKQALIAVADLLINAIDQEKKVKGKFQIKENFLPFRPIVYGGDDITFVCDGRIGLPLAVKFMKEFEEPTKNLPDEKGKATACAGIAIVKTHYPFSRNYELCEQLCSNAKKFVRQETDDYSDRKTIFSALDWHIAASSLLGSIGEIREREYQGGKLTTRPMRSHDYTDSWLTWTDFSEVVRSFNEEEPWKDKRNKIIALREVLREGKTATEQFLQAYGIEELPTFPKANSSLKKQGWDAGICRYFDAIEAMEFYIPLGE